MGNARMCDGTGSSRSDRLALDQSTLEARNAQQLISGFPDGLGSACVSRAALGVPPTITSMAWAGAQTDTRDACAPRTEHLDAQTLRGSHVNRGK